MDKPKNRSIGAVVLAAGKSTRMGEPKMLLPWGKSSVLRTVILTLLAAKIEPIIVVTGANRELIEGEIRDLAVQPVHNPAYELGEMLSSLQAGLKALPDDLESVLIALGDQPFFQVDLIKELQNLRETTNKGIIIPSYQMKRGHPWILDTKYKSEVLALDNRTQTMRDFLALHPEEIVFLKVKSDDILKDLDTPQDYQREKPHHS
jgi:molybdenum cofactor cytidylyltransferase